MTLTGQQQAIVRDVDRDVVVTAGAGTGKTRTLVERYLFLLQSHRIGEIVAVTFTDAAASEMRERVRREIMSRDDLASHRAELDRAVIGTIHSLCLQMLREHPVEAGIDPAGAVLPEDEAEVELLNACDEALEAALADGRGLLCLRELGDYWIRQMLPEMVRRRDEVAQAYCSMPGDSVQEWAEGISELMDNVAAVEVEEAHPRIEEWYMFLERAHMAAGPDALWECVGRVLDILKRHFTLSLEDLFVFNWKGLRDDVVEAGEEVNLKGGSQKNWGDNLDDVKETLRNLRDLAKEFDNLPEWNDHDGLALQVIADFRGLFDDACIRYQQRKDSLGGLDYLDLEIRARDMLRDHPAIADVYRQRFQHLMVDELQDTNPSQIQVIRLLRQDGGPKAFFVGDAKQSIYRFRGGDVRTFKRLQREVGEGVGLHSLTRTFRDHDQLVSVINGLFSRVFENATEDFEAEMQTMQGIGRDAPALPCVVVMQVAKKTPDGETAREYQKRRVEADAVAGEVAELLREGVLVWDANLGENRRVAPSDVAILLRRLSNVQLFEQALENRSVPYRTMSGLGFFKRQEIVDLTNLVKWLAAPDDDIALVGLLRSPMFMLDDQTILRLCSHRNGLNLLDSLQEPPSDVMDEALEFSLRAWHTLTDLRRDANWVSAHDLVEKALAVTAFEASWSALSGGEQALANIRKFVGMLRGLRGYSLDETASYLRRRAEDSNVRENQAPLDDLEAVQLMTIHGAKGLEFPIVFVPECDKPSQNRLPTVLWRREEGMSVTLVAELDGDGRRRKPGFHGFLGMLEKWEEAAEYKRLFYVAATRAADKLYLSGAETGRSETWLSMALEVFGGNQGEVEDIRPLIPADMESIARRRRPPFIRPPDDAAERDVASPLVPRPSVSPMRSSTPVTDLETVEKHYGFRRYGPGLGLARGRLAHEAIEAWFTSGSRPNLREMAARLDEGLNEEQTVRLCGEVDAMLDWLDASSLAATLREKGTIAYFEMPFSWDWDSAPVHGVMDLVYRNGGSWRVVDFKTDDVRGVPMEQAAAGYLSQLAVYREALRQATGEAPQASLAFLRVGQVYTPPDEDLARALESVRHGIAAGLPSAEALEAPEGE